MADFKQAIKWAREGKGKEVRRKSWEGKSIKGYKPDIKEYSFSLEDFEATDWEIYCKEHDWGTAGQEYTKEEGTFYYLTCKNCGFKKKESPKESLSDKIYKSALGAERCPDSIFVEDIKYKIQNAQKRLHRDFHNRRREEPIDGIDKIFKEEFGNKLILKEEIGGENVRNN